MARHNKIADVDYVWQRWKDQSHNKRIYQNRREKEWDLTWLCGEGDPQGIVQETKIWAYEQMAYEQPWISTEKWDPHSSLGF